MGERERNDARRPDAQPGFSGSAPGPETDDGVITFRGMDSVALAFVSISSIREHQASLVQERLLGLAERSKGRLAVSMADVTDMTSAGINALVAVHARCKALGGHLALFAVSRDLRRMLKVTKLDREINLAENAHEAVRSFDAPPKRSFWKQAFTWARHEKDAA